MPLNLSSATTRSALAEPCAALTLGVLPLTPERQRLMDAGLDPGPIEEADDFYIMRMRDPDGNLVVFASAQRD
ncbi:VOC family protein [Mesorhizobium sangaii]|uniref:Uncharacterized protein n=1 Tax=Mesorhizobium sangaii TaxID=505389 RepID=A0A841PP50_9HYPH|nr:hypothetical protein [Mesorhizobium sangaii]MBB6412420.1 hypothetical protein [Mesorhizobium sangaii]